MPAAVNSPRRAAFIAAIVFAFGTSGSNGKAFYAAIRFTKASDRVNPIAASTAAASAFVVSSMRARITEFSFMATQKYDLSYNVAQSVLFVKCILDSMRVMRSKFRIG